MARGLSLTTLIPAGSGRYSTGKAVMDVSRLNDATLLLQVVQALDLGFQCRLRSPLMTAMCSALDTGKSGGVAFFSVAAEAVAGTHAQAGDSGADGGFSLWRYQGAWNRLDAPVLERDSLRVWLNPTGGNFSVTGNGFEYNRLVNVLWHELHHCTTTQHHLRAAAPYADNDPWKVAIADIARAFPRTARDPVTGQQVTLFAPDQWTQAGRLRRAIG